MRCGHFLSALLVSYVLLWASNAAHASLTLASGLPVSHVGNLVNNGSFEIGAPPDGMANFNYWANPAQSPYMVPPGWLSSGPNSTAVWGNDGPSPYTTKFSDTLPDGRAAVDFRTATGVTVDQPPTFHPNGTVTFPAAPTFTSLAGAPVILHQTVHTELAPAPSYNLHFWVSGEENATNQGNTGVGILGLRVTNVLPGDPIQWLAVPNAFAYGLSAVYEFNFVPLNSSLPVNVAFINWGGLDLSAYSMSPFGTQPIVDDVIINGAPEPGSMTLAIVGAAGALLAWRRRSLGGRRSC